MPGSQEFLCNLARRKIAPNTGANATTFFVRAIDEGLTLETSAFLPFTVANLRFQPSC